MSRIPADIDAVISKIDREGQHDLLPRTDEPADRYDERVRMALPNTYPINITEFDYGRSYRYSISLSKNRDAASLDVERLRDALQKEGHIDEVHLAISAITPYFHLRFAQNSLEDGEMIKAWSDEPINAAQSEAATALITALLHQGLRKIEPQIARAMVPDVKIENCEAGEATVANCLFYG